MKVLVTGAGGFIGRYSVDELLRRGHTVTAMVRPGSRVPTSLEAEGVTVMECDLRRPPETLASAVSESDAIVHLASSTGSGWRGALENMVVGTENLLDAIREARWRGRFVHVSSFAVYGFNQMPRGSHLDEDSPLEPNPGRRDVYAWGKSLQERTIRQARDAGDLDAVIVRPGAVYGAEKQFQYRLGREVAGRFLVVLGGRNVMPLTYVENTASLLVRCVEDPAASGQVFNCVDPSEVTQLQYAKRYAAARPTKMRVIPVPLVILDLVGHALEIGRRRTDGRISPPGMLDPYIYRPSFLRLDFHTDRAQRLLDWSPPVGGNEALRRTFSS